MGRERLRFYNHFAEQTTWAALAGRVDSYCFDPVQVCIPTPGMTFQPGLVALHYVGLRRFMTAEPEHLGRREAYSRDLVGVEAATIRTRPAIYRTLAESVVRTAFSKIRPTLPNPVAILMGHSPSLKQDPWPTDRLATPRSARTEPTPVAPPEARL